MPTIRCSRPMLTLLLSALIAGLSSPSSATEVRFRYQPPEGASSVSVAGSFNDWNVGANPLEDPDGDGLWTTRMDLPPGKHPYKFVVDGNQWLTDESAEEFADDGFGGRNSILIVGSETLTVNTAPVAGQTATITGETSAVTDTAVRFRFRPPEDAQTVTVAGTFNDWNLLADPLGDGDDDGVWETTLRVPHGRIQYKFVVNGTDWFTDETASEFADDGFGGKNSVVQVGTTPITVGEPGGNASGPEESGAEVIFRYRPTVGGVNAVSVAGSFNGWDAAADPMSDEDGDGVWEVRLRLLPARYAYQFVVNGDHWFTDDSAADHEDDGFGGRNALLEVDSTAVVTDPEENTDADEN